MKTDEEILSQLIRERESTDRKRINKEYVNTVLDKIRAEIQAMPTDYCGGYIGLDKQEVLKIINKYREEQE